MKIENEEALTAQIEENKTNGKSLIVKFGADWCGPCRSLDPTLEQIEANNENVVVASINVDTLGDLTVKYGVRSVPAVFIYKNGEVSQNFVGNKPAAEINSML